MQLALPRQRRRLDQNRYFFPVELISSSSESVSDDVGGIEVDSVEECPSDTAAMSNGDPERSDATTESSDPDDYVKMDYASVLWKQQHPNQYWFGHSAIICFNTF